MSMPSSGSEKPARAELILTYEAPTQFVTCLDWSPSGKHIASVGADHRGLVWEAFSGKTLLDYEGHISGVNTIGWSPSGKHIASGGEWDARVHVWEALS